MQINKQLAYLSISQSIDQINEEQKYKRRAKKKKEKISVQTNKSVIAIQ